MTLAGAPSVQPARMTRVPRTEARATAFLLSARSGWEYFYFAGQLLYERDSAEAKCRGRETHYPAPGAEAVTADDIVRYVEYIDERFDDAMSLAKQVSVIIR